jgi:hypothetical protein
MHLSKIRVRNFRNLKDLEVAFSGGLNVNVGENNVGKTNLLEAIRAALGPASFAGDPLRLVKEDRHRNAEGIPDKRMSGMTFTQVREFYADLAFALYRLRNLTVHEGELTPTVDDVIADQSEGIASAATRSILWFAQTGKIGRVEEILAWILKLNPAASVPIP